MKINRRAGCHWVDDKPYISVTNVLKVIRKPGIEWWKQHETYLAVAKDPSIDEKAAMAAPYITSGKAKDRGTTVHSIVEAYKNGVEIKDVPDEFQGYVDAFNDFISDHDIEVVEQEKFVVSKTYGYAGICDLIIKLNPHGGETIVCDVKTGKDLYPEVWLQTSAYLQALKENKVDVTGTSALLLKEDGTYKFERGTDQFFYFKAAKKLYEWQNRTKLEKLGYELNADII